jgi:Kef-type K+ transport system membrane component KefB
VVAGTLLAQTASAAEPGAHLNPVGPLLLALAIILVAARLGGDLVTRIGQPAVLGELAVGMLLGNLRIGGVSPFEWMKSDAFIDVLARLGVVILLFEVGLESTVRQMLRIGPSATLVAALGVAAPFALGWGVGAWLLPSASGYAHAFLGATLSATSVGITARVLQDLGQSQTPEARTILGAAVLDDVFGLVILAVVSGAIDAAEQGKTVEYTQIAIIVGKATAFLVGSLALGVYASPRLFSTASRLQGRGVLLAVGLSFCFLLAWLADSIGLAPIVGAFAAGLILEDVHHKDFVARGEYGLEQLVRPISSFLVPVFFVLMGMRTDLRSFAAPGVLGLAAALTAAAILGKQACALGVIGGGVDRLSVAIGMVPRGEVGLIFASMGMTLKVAGKPVLDEAAFSSVVMMVMITTMVTPPALKWSLSRR